MLRRLSILLLALFLAVVTPLSAFGTTFAQDGSPVAVQPESDPVQSAADESAPTPTAKLRRETISQRKAVTPRPVRASMT